MIFGNEKFNVQTVIGLCQLIPGHRVVLRHIPVPTVLRSYADPQSETVITAPVLLVQI